MKPLDAESTDGNLVYLSHAYTGYKFEMLKNRTAFLHNKLCLVVALNLLSLFIHYN